MNEQHRVNEEGVEKERSLQMAKKDRLIKLLAGEKFLALLKAGKVKPVDIFRLPFVVLVASPVLWNLSFCLLAFEIGVRFYDTPWIAYLFGVLSMFATGAGFAAYFNHAVDNRIAVGAILLNGAILIVLFGVIHTGVGVVYVGGQDMGELYRPGFWDGLYFSIVSFTTLGYGDFQPYQPMRMFSALQALFGYAYLGLMVAVFHDWLSSIRSRGGS